MANNSVAAGLSLVKIEDGWLDASGAWKVIKGYKGYMVSHLPSGKMQGCCAAKTLAEAVDLMRDYYLDNRSYFYLP